MSPAKRKTPFPNPPEVKPGDWQGEILDGHTLRTPCRTVRRGSPLNFSSIVTPTSPDVQFAWPGIVLTFAPLPAPTNKVHNAFHLERHSHGAALRRWANSETAWPLCDRLS
jgi:hypothetical protein